MKITNRILKDIKVVFLFFFVFSLGVNLNAQVDAKELLENYTYSTVNEVACAVGLKDPYYFSSIYKKEFGKKPKEYLV